jgi:hypothetical protein
MSLSCCTCRCLLFAICRFLVWLTVRPWCWKQYTTPECWETSTEPTGINWRLVAQTVGGLTSSRRSSWRVARIEMRQLPLSVFLALTDVLQEHLPNTGCDLTQFLLLLLYKRHTNFYESIIFMWLFNFKSCVFDSARMFYMLTGVTEHKVHNNSTATHNTTDYSTLRAVWMIQLKCFICSQHYRTQTSQQLNSYTQHNQFPKTRVILFSSWFGLPHNPSEGQSYLPITP